MILIAAIDRDWGIGRNNRLLVSIPEDMRFFRKMTTGGTVIMGRKTLDTFPEGKPLKNRRNIVLSKDPSLSVEGAEKAENIWKALAMVSDENPDRVFCIGGASVYRQFLVFCNTAYITKIDHSFGAEVFLPNLDEIDEWNLAVEGKRREWNGIGYRFTKYEKKSGIFTETAGKD